MCFFGAFRPVRNTTQLWERFVIVLSELLNTFDSLYDECVSFKSFQGFRLSAETLRHESQNGRSAVLSTVTSLIVERFHFKQSIS